MIVGVARRINLNGNQQAELHAHLRRHNLPASVAQRMRLVLMLGDGASYSEIQEALETATTTISQWKKRYEQDGLEGPATFHPGQTSSPAFAGLARPDPQQTTTATAGWVHTLETHASVVSAQSVLRLAGWRRCHC
jgi:transposase-like protein